MPSSARRLLRTWLPFIISALVVGGFGIGGQGASNTAPLPPAGSRQDCTVLRVSDGDTVAVDCGAGQLRVRVWGLDAPEMGQQPWGAGAREALRASLSATVSIEVLDHDRYGRAVARLYDGHHDLGLALLRGGWAAVYRPYNNDADYLAAEQQARGQRLGIWANPGFQQTPWLWRRYNPPSGAS